MGVAIADQLEGPYVFHDRPLTSNRGTIEDGFAFIKNGTVHLLTTDNKKAAGLLWTSHDGITYGEPTLGFGKMDHYVSKKVVEEATNYRGRIFERPQGAALERPTHTPVVSRWREYQPRRRPHSGISGRDLPLLCNQSVSLRPTLLSAQTGSEF